MSEEELVKIVHSILNYEYRLFIKRKDIHKVYLTENELINIIRKTIDTDISLERILSTLINKGYLVKYESCIGENASNPCYRSIYFDVIADYVNIRERRLGKPTILEYKIIGDENNLITQPIPQYNISCRKLVSETHEVIDKYISGLTGKDRDFLKTLIQNILCLRENYSKFQYESIKNLIRSFLSRSSGTYIINAPTGWGKTEAFFIPLLIYSVIKKFLDKTSHISNGVKAIIIYPRKALASNQIKRFIEYYIKLSRSMQGKTPYPIYEILPLIAIRDGQSIDSRKYKEGEPFRIRKLVLENGREKFDVKIESIDRIMIVPSGKNRSTPIVLPFTNVYFEKENIVPDIVVTNLTTFNRFLSTPRFASLWKNPYSIGAIVFDEAHTYNGMSFLHLEYIIKRMIYFLYHLQKEIAGSDNKVNMPTMVFSSATLPRNFKEEIEKILNEIYRKGLKQISPAPYYIDTVGSEDPLHKKIILPVILAPQPNVAGQWIVQLITIYNTLFALQRAYKKYKKVDMVKGESIPFKSIIFIDSLSYLREIFDHVNTLLQRIDSIAYEHSPEALGLSEENISDHIDLWSFIDHNYIEFLRDEAKKKLDYLIKVHYGDLPQEKREEVEEYFRERTLPTTLLSTSTLELGIDIPDLWNIAQFRPPITAESFIQRIGRAGRKNKTLRVALGTLILTNQPSDIVYVYDEKKARRLFEVPELRKPINDTVKKQHIFISIFDYLNTLYISGKLDDKYQDTLNSLYYRSSIFQKDSMKVLKDIANLVKDHYDKIIKYSSTLFSPRKLVIETVNEIVSDINYIRNPVEIVKMLREKGIIKKIQYLSEKINEIIKDLQGLYTYKHSYSSDFQEARFKLSELGLGKAIGDLQDQLQKLISPPIDDDKLEKWINELYNKIIPKIENYFPSIEEIIDQVNESRIKIRVNQEKQILSGIVNSLINIKNLCENIVRLVRDNEMVRELISIENNLAEVSEQSDNLASYLSILTQKGMYYSELLSEPLKHAQINYGEGTPRNEPISIAMWRIANFSIFKPLY